MKTISILIMFIGTTLAQTVYEIQPGTKGNEIKLTVANVSEENSAQNVSIKPPQPLQRRGLQEESITFHQSEQTIDIINPGEEREVIFTFDVERTASVNRKDTIEFKITDGSGIMMTKQFIFSYTGPKEFKLEQNYPNPFNPSTKIRYSIPTTPLSPPWQGGEARQGWLTVLKVYDILGNEVTTLVNEEKEPGYYEVEFNATQYASGVYVYKLQSSHGYSEVKKMLLLK